MSYRAAPPAALRVSDARGPTILSGLLLGVLLYACPASAQQFVTEDAAIVGRGACQLEVWHGERQSWLEPACQFIPRLEVTLGVGLIDPPNRSTEYLLEVKTLVRDFDEGRYGWV
jgi:hypothetical protein